MKAILVAALPLMLAACASTPDTASSDSQETKVYRTGSNLPVRDPEASSTNKTIDSSTMRPQPVPSLNPNRTGG